MPTVPDQMQQALPFESAPGTLTSSNASGTLAPSRAGTLAPAHSRTLALVFVRHPRARRYILRVADDGTVRVTIPRRGSRREAFAFAERERRWIEDERRRVEEERSRRLPDEIAPDVERELRERAGRELPHRLLALAAAHGIAVSRVSVRNQRWRWGSCSPKGHICLNWRLVQMPDPVRDYVLIHELMHVKRMDHSPTFWKLVASACPDYMAARKWLSAQPHSAGQRMIGTRDPRTATRAPCSDRSTDTPETARAAPAVRP